MNNFNKASADSPKPRNKPLPLKPTRPKRIYPKLSTSDCFHRALNAFTMAKYKTNSQNYQTSFTRGKIYPLFQSENKTNKKQSKIHFPVLLSRLFMRKGSHIGGNPNIYTKNNCEHNTNTHIRGKKKKKKSPTARPNLHSTQLVSNTLQYKNTWCE